MITARNISETNMPLNTKQAYSPVEAEEIKIQQAIVKKIKLL
ncbi:hypothetical protein [Pseudoalteromonas sp. '520P1 No. 423']|nr:hypothetical protein [Pseudoalteromonas sp. '520P1 No. 423']